MNSPSKVKHALATLAVLDITMASLLVGLLVVVAVFLGGAMLVFVSYQQAFAGLCCLLGALCSGLYVHAFALIKDVSRKQGAPRQGQHAWIVQGLVPVIIYSALTLVGIVLFALTSTSFGSLLQDIGAEFMNAAVFLSIASLAILCIVIACHVDLLLRGISRGKGKEIRSPVQEIRKWHFPAITRQSIGKLQAMAMLLAIAGTIITYGVNVLNLPQKCFTGFHGFSAPAYDLAAVQAGGHANAALDALAGENRSLLETLERALWQMTTTQSQGGFPLEALLDGSEFYSDRGPGCPLHPGEFSIQGGTPLIAGVYLSMYKLDPNPVYLNVAAAAARALMAVQDAGNGGFYYDGRLYPDGKGYQPHPRNPMHSAVFDDNTMQSALAFLLDMYSVTGNVTYRNAALRGLDYIFQLEKPGGGWPQRSNYGPDEYQSYVTLNDDCMRDLVNLMFKAHDIFGDPRYMQAAERAGQFLIRVQGHGCGSNAKQSGAWAQQYKNDQPAWARRFEPPAMCSIDTAHAIEMLVDLYLRTGNETYLDPIPAAVAWLTDANTTIEDAWNITSAPGDFIWARLYELGSNHLIVGNRNNQGNGIVYYYDYVPSRDYGYSWVGSYGINGTLSRYDYLINVCGKNISQYIAWRDTPPSISSLLSGALHANSTIHSSGFWLDGEGKIDDEMFYYNAMRIIDYLDAIT
ncbi:MAG: pectate lyase [Candidatus Sigynarchaeota archaeon]